MCIPGYFLVATWHQIKISFARNGSNFRFSFRKRGKIDSNLFPIMMWHKGYAAYDTLEICMPSKLNLSIFPGFFFSSVCMLLDAWALPPSLRGDASLTWHEGLYAFRTQGARVPGKICEALIFLAFVYYAKLHPCRCLTHIYCGLLICFFIPISLSLSSSTLSFYALVGHKNPIDSTRLSGSDWVVWKMQAIWICSGTNR